MDAQPNIKLAVPFFMVRDMQRSLIFYTEKLGFTLTNQWVPHNKIEWCWLNRDSVSIMLQEPRNKNDYLPGARLGHGLSICFQCADALALYHEFSARGVEITEPFVGNHMWVVAFTDPDGYKLDFESPTAIAEETTYTTWLNSQR